MSEVKVKRRRKYQLVPKDTLDRMIEAVERQTRQLDNLDFLMSIDLASRLSLREAAVFLALRGCKVYYASHTYEEKGILFKTKRYSYEEFYSGGYE